MRERRQEECLEEVAGFRPETPESAVSTLDDFQNWLQYAIKLEKLKEVASVEVTFPYGTPSLVSYRYGIALEYLKEYRSGKLIRKTKEEKERLERE